MKGIANNPLERRNKFRQSLKEKQMNRIGEKFDRLTIIDIEIGEKRTLCVCQCECGNIHKIPYYDLTSGKVRSCGCLHKELVSKHQSSITHKNSYGYNWYFIKNGIKINCESSYEAIIANYFIDNNIKFEYHYKTFQMPENKNYTPDFYLVDDNKYIEVKGSFWDNIHEYKPYNILSNIYDVVLEIYTWDIIKNKVNIPYCQSSGIIRAAHRANIKPEEYINERRYLKQLIK